MSATQMRAVVITEPRRSRLEKVDLPQPGPGEVRVRVAGCGVCGSNLPVWEGRPWFSYPFAPPGAPGHEGWGVVDAIGPDVHNVAPGERIAFLSQRAYAEYDTTSIDDVARIPPSLENTPLPAEPLACALNVHERAQIERRQRVVIIGVGFLGALITQLAARSGAQVVALSRRPFARDVALQMGASAAFSIEDSDVVARVRKAIAADGAECVIECVGSQGALDLATELTAVRGRLVVAGYHQDGARTVNMQLWNWRGLDVINAHERAPERYRSGMRAAIAALESGELVLQPLLTHTFLLAELDRAMSTVHERPDGFLKALVTT